MPVQPPRRTYEHSCAANFKNCELAGAMVKGMDLTRTQADQVVLDRSHTAEAGWHLDNGEIPGGGSHRGSASTNANTREGASRVLVIQSG